MNTKTKYSAQLKQVMSMSFEDIIENKVMNDNNGGLTNLNSIGELDDVEEVGYVSDGLVTLQNSDNDDMVGMDDLIESFSKTSIKRHLTDDYNSSNKMQVVENLVAEEQIEECIICCVTYGDEVIKISSPLCHHSMCRNCWKEIFLSSQKCPLCRLSIHMDDWAREPFNFVVVNHPIIHNRRINHCGNCRRAGHKRTTCIQQCRLCGIGPCSSRYHRIIDNNVCRFQRR